MSHDLHTDEEALQSNALPPREDLLASAALGKTRRLGALTLRPLTAETLSYLFEVENFFIRGIQGQRISPQNANAIWSVAEFVYIHAANPDDVAENVWVRSDFRTAVREFLAGPLNDPQILIQALPLIEQIVAEYFAAQNQAAPQPVKGRSLKRPGKAPARPGKPAI